MFLHKQRCQKSNCLCSSYKMVKQSDKMTSDEIAQVQPSTRRTAISFLQSKSITLNSKIPVNNIQKEENHNLKIEKDEKLIYELLKTILQERIKNEPSCYLYIYKSYIEKYYLSEKFQALTTISSAVQENPTLYEQFLIFCFKYIYILYI